MIAILYPHSVIVVSPTTDLKRTTPRRKTDTETQKNVRLLKTKTHYKYKNVESGACSTSLL
jgi:hypothetical protein